MFTALLFVALAHAVPSSVPLDASARPDPQSFFAWLGLCAPGVPCDTLTGPAWMVAAGLRHLPTQRRVIDLGHDVVIDLEALRWEPEINMLRLIDDRTEPEP